MFSFTRLAALLNKEVKKKESPQFELDNVERMEVNSPKGKLITPTVLALRRPDGQYTLRTDACNTKVGCVLLREQNDKTLKAVNYWSRLLCDADTCFGATLTECSVVVRTILQPCQYLKRTLFIFRSHHSFLRWILDLKVFTGRLAQWRLCFLMFDWEVFHQPAVHH